MRTVRCSGRLGGGMLAQGVPAHGGCLPRGQGVSGRGVLPRRGVCPAGVCPEGVYTSPRWHTDTCKNITFPQLLLRTVKIVTIKFPI